MTNERAPAQFDAYAEEYRATLERGVRLSGEDSEFFARGRVEWTGRRLQEHRLTPRTILDFGCGAASTTPFLLALEGAERLIGTDVSSELLKLARRDYGSNRATFGGIEAVPEASVDLAYCNGVFHHIRPSDRPAAIATVRAALRPGGLFAFWENNPWNPGTRLVMRRIPFDRDAITLTAPESRRLLRDQGFDDLTVDFLFVFPKPLTALRPLERYLVGLPLGAQYLVLARRPG